MRATLRLTSAMVAAPRTSRPQARYVLLRGSARISWFSRANTSVNTCGKAGQCSSKGTQVNTWAKVGQRCSKVRLWMPSGRGKPV